MFEIVNIYNGNKSDSEQVMLLATEDVNIRNYQIEDKTFRIGKNTNVFRHVFRFPDLDVKKGEYVAVFTCKGKPYQTWYNGAKCHVLYWGSNQPIWNDDENDAVELLKVYTKQVFNTKRKRA